MAPSAPTYLESVGDGPPVVLVHGVGLDHTMWRRLIGQLPQDRRYITYDMWGHGRTPRFSPDGAGPRAPALGDFTRQLADVIAAGTAEPPVLIGFSMGHFVTLLVLLFLSGLFSGSETALTSLSMARVEGLPCAILNEAKNRISVA